MSLLEYVDEILSRGLDDWIQLAEVVSVVRRIQPGASQDEVRQIAIEIVRKVIQPGLMKVGDVTRDGFHEWTLTPHESVARIEHEWIALGRGPDLGEICWLSNTDAGNEWARAK